MKGGNNMKCGIYKITNLINGKIYIGCSKNIEHRWIAHKSESILEHNPQYNYSIHKAFRKYGIDNFSFEIIELVSEQELFDKEKYWIAFYDSYNKGYNETKGGDCGPSMPGESNPNAKLLRADIIAIRSALLEGKMPSEVFPAYADRITRKGFDYIWRGESWKEILPEAIEYVKSEEYLKKAKAYAAKSAIPSEKKEMWEDIRNKKQKGLKRLDVYEEYKDKYSLSGFNKVWYRL